MVEVAEIKALDVSDFVLRAEERKDLHLAALVVLLVTNC